MDSSLGERELALLRHVVESDSATVGEVAETFGAPRGLSRTTCLTMMERLRAKGRLQRRKSAGVFRYFSPESRGELLGGVVRRFVERSLGGSVTPVVDYLVERSDFSAGEIAELEALVRRIRSRAGENAQTVKEEER